MTSPATLAALFIAFVLSCLVPTNAAAQITTCPANLTDTWPDNTLCLGPVTVTVNGTDIDINLNLILPVTLNDQTTATTDDKLYYYLDHDNGGSATSGDLITHNQLDALLNGGNDTIDTQDGNHDGSNDARSVIVGDYTLVLPTLAEMQALRTDQGNRLPSGWLNRAYHTATLSENNIHKTYALATGRAGIGSGGLNIAVAFQVIPKDLLFRIKVFLEGAQ